MGQEQDKCVLMIEGTMPRGSGIGRTGWPAVCRCCGEGMNGGRGPRIALPSPSMLTDVACGNGPFPV